MALLLFFFFLALIVGLLIQIRSHTAMISAALWGCYAVYEYLIYARILCSGDCNIRIDLLIIYTVLLMFTAAALVRFLRGKLKKSEKSESL